MMPACNGRDHLKEIASVLLLDFLGDVRGEDCLEAGLFLGASPKPMS